MRNDFIVRVAPDGALRDSGAAKHIDAQGRVLAPGFIDIQGQSYDVLLTGDGRDVSKITQGVTTEILGEGSTPAPVNDKILATIPADRHRRPPPARALHRRPRLREVARRDAGASAIP